jgi:hypothetical protein
MVFTKIKQEETYKKFNPEAFKANNYNTFNKENLKKGSDMNLSNYVPRNE